jgi:hypothetical protein
MRSTCSTSTKMSNTWLNKFTTTNRRSFMSTTSQSLLKIILELSTDLSFTRLTRSSLKNTTILTTMRFTENSTNLNAGQSSELLLMKLPK